MSNLVIKSTTRLKTSIQQHKTNHSNQHNQNQITKNNNTQHKTQKGKTKFHIKQKPSTTHYNNKKKKHPQHHKSKNKYTTQTHIQNQSTIAAAEPEKSTKKHETLFWVSLFNLKEQIFTKNKRLISSVHLHSI